MDEADKIKLAWKVRSRVAMPVLSDDEREFAGFTRRRISDHVLKIYSATGNMKSVGGVPYGMQSTMKAFEDSGITHSDFVLSRAEYKDLNEDLWLREALSRNGIETVPDSFYIVEEFNGEDDDDE